MRSRGSMADSLAEDKSPRSQLSTLFTAVCSRVPRPSERLTVVGLWHRQAAGELLYYCYQPI